MCAKACKKRLLVKSVWRDCGATALRTGHREFEEVVRAVSGSGRGHNTTLLQQTLNDTAVPPSMPLAASWSAVSLLSHLCCVSCGFTPSLSLCITRSLSHSHPLLDICLCLHHQQVQIYVDRGLSEVLARQVARELTDKDVVRAHARDELGIDLDSLANPWQASIHYSLPDWQGESLVRAIAAACGFQLWLQSRAAAACAGRRRHVVAHLHVLSFLLPSSPHNHHIRPAGHRGCPSASALSCRCWLVLSFQTGVPASSACVW